MPRGRVLHDRYFRQAKREGYLARSAYKLLELDQRKKLLKRDQFVLDLGCAPGSWLQVASDRIGPKGVVVGVDLLPVRHPMPKTVRTIEADMHAVDPEDLRRTTGGEPFGLVLSDMAPNTSGGGGGSGDHFRSVRLCEDILELVPAVLAHRGSLVMKVFDGEAMPDLLGRCKRMFFKVSCCTPKATREVSRETYIICQGYKGPPRAHEVDADPGNNTETNPRA